MNERINLETLKTFVGKKLQDYPITREFILEEPTAITIGDFMAKITIWLRLLEKEIREKEFD